MKKFEAVIKELKRIVGGLGWRLTESEGFYTIIVYVLNDFSLSNGKQILSFTRYCTNNQAKEKFLNAYAEVLKHELIRIGILHQLEVSDTDITLTEAEIETRIGNRNNFDFEELEDPRPVLEEAPIRRNRRGRATTNIETREINPVGRVFRGGIVRDMNIQNEAGGELRWIDTDVARLRASGLTPMEFSEGGEPIVE